MRCRTLILLIPLIVAPVYAAAQSPSARAVADKLHFELGQPHKVPPFPLVLNAAVQAYVDSYLAHSEGLRLSYARSAPYLSQMTEVLREYGVPSDLVYLAFAESSFSKGGAGPWQLTKATARELGLVVNQFLDERRDPLKSTRAAAEYLAQLHDQIGDWRLTIIAWNTGQGMLSHFVQDRGEDFDRLLEHLPARTRSLLTRFMAVAFISKNAREFGIQEVVYSQPTTIRADQRSRRHSAEQGRRGDPFPGLRDSAPQSSHPYRPGPARRLRCGDSAVQQGRRRHGLGGWWFAPSSRIISDISDKTNR